MKKALEYILSGLIALSVVAPIAAIAATQYGAGTLLQVGDVQSSHILNGTVLDIDVSESARISGTKIAGGGVGGLLILSNNTQLATSTNLKYATSTNDFYVLGGRIHATSTNFGGVNQTWPSADGTSGQVLSTNGAGAFSWSSLTSGLISTSMTAGSALSTGDVVFLATTTMATTTIAAEVDQGSANGIGVASGDSEKLAQSFQQAGMFNVLRLFLVKAGSPTDNITCGIQADSAGSPSGTFLASATIAASSVSATLGSVYFVLDDVVYLAAATTYYVVCQRSGAFDGANIVNWERQPGDTYASGSAIKYTTSWVTAGAGIDFSLSIGQAVTLGRMYKASATTNALSGDYLGIAQSSVSAGASVSVDLLGISTANVGMTIGRNIYLSNTFGATSTSPGTISVLLGKAISSSKLYLK